MRIKTWKAWQDPVGGPHWTCRHKSEVVSSPVRIVPEATWKKIMGVVKAADRDSPVGIAFAMDHLREYLRKRK
jgi:hypothetical protein